MLSKLNFEDRLFKRDDGEHLNMKTQYANLKKLESPPKINSLIIPLYSSKEIEQFY